MEIKRKKKKHGHPDTTTAKTEKPVGFVCC